MKIRKMFVANSSSATYVVKLHVNIDAFIKELDNQFSWSFFDIQDLKKETIKHRDMLLECIKEIETKIGENPDKNEQFQQYISAKPINDEDGKKIGIDGMQFFFWGQNQKRLAEVESWIKRFDDGILTNELITELLTKYYHITLEYDEQGKIITLSSYTNMHNDYGSMSELLKEITLYYLMETNVKLECELIDHDNNINERFIDLEEEK